MFGKNVWENHVLEKENPQERPQIFLDQMREEGGRGTVGQSVLDVDTNKGSENNMKKVLMISTLAADGGSVSSHLLPRFYSWKVEE